jgi:hypothetical protein
MPNNNGLPNTLFARRGGRWVVGKRSFGALILSSPHLSSLLPDHEPLRVYERAAIRFLHAQRTTEL